MHLDMIYILMDNKNYASRKLKRLIIWNGKSPSSSSSDINDPADLALISTFFGHKSDPFQLMATIMHIDFLQLARYSIRPKKTSSIQNLSQKINLESACACKNQLVAETFGLFTLANNNNI